MEWNRIKTQKFMHKIMFSICCAQPSDNNVKMRCNLQGGMHRATGWKEKSIWHSMHNGSLVLCVCECLWAWASTVTNKNNHDVILSSSCIIRGGSSLKSSSERRKKGSRRSTKKAFSSTTSSYLFLLDFLLVHWLETSSFYPFHTTKIRKLNQILLYCHFQEQS